MTPTAPNAGQRFSAGDGEGEKLAEGQECPKCGREVLMVERSKPRPNNGCMLMHTHSIIMLYLAVERAV